MTALPFYIQDWFAWIPGRAGDAAQVGHADIGPIASRQPIPLLLRRRISPLGQQALKAAWSLSASATARMVFCSRHGEFSRTLSILDAIANHTEVSPADFTLSVHNALMGLLSIVRNNRHGHIAVAAGEESFGFGMMEALACLVERPEEPVLLVYFDEPLPLPFTGFVPHASGPIVLALTLTTNGGTTNEGTSHQGESVTLTTSPASGVLTGPDSFASTFLHFLSGTAPAASVAGEQLVWHWRRAGTSN